MSLPATQGAVKPEKCYAGQASVPIASPGLGRQPVGVERQGHPDTSYEGEATPLGEPVTLLFAQTPELADGCPCTGKGCSAGQLPGVRMRVNQGEGRPWAL